MNKNLLILGLLVVVGVIFYFGSMQGFFAPAAWAFHWSCPEMSTGQVVGTSETFVQLPLTTVACDVGVVYWHTDPAEGYQVVRNVVKYDGVTQFDGMRCDWTTSGGEYCQSEVSQGSSSLTCGSHTYEVQTEYTGTHATPEVVTGTWSIPCEGGAATPPVSDSPGAVGGSPAVGVGGAVNSAGLQLSTFVNSIIQKVLSFLGVTF